VKRVDRVTPTRILLIEDDPGDQKLIKSSLRNQGIISELHISSSAEEALDFLHYGEDSNDGDYHPDLILLDLNMSGMGGKEFLKQIKDEESLRQIPVVVLTTSNAEIDIIDCYRLQAAGYIQKPMTLGEFKQVVGEIGKYWFTLCGLPIRTY
jgi:CheY-like chemotaxis protein